MDVHSIIGRFFMRKLNFNQPYRYEDLQRDIQYLQTTYPKLLKVFRLGVSHDGRELFVIRVGNGPIPIVITAGVHGRETINPMVVMRILENYLQLYEAKEPVIVDFTLEQRKLREYRRTEDEVPNKFEAATKYNSIPTDYFVAEYPSLFTFYIVPLLNPDGYEIALGGFETLQKEELRNTAKAKGIATEEWKGNARGVDINRNFPSLTWRSKFEGDQPATEYETQALIQLFEQVQPKGYLDLHSRGKAIYYHKGSMSQEYNQIQRIIADRLKMVTGYELMPLEDEIEVSDSGGNTVHYFSERFHQPAITIETVTDLEPFPLDERYQRPTFEEIFLVPLEFAAALYELS